MTSRARETQVGYSTQKMYDLTLLVSEHETVEHTQVTEGELRNNTADLEMFEEHVETIPQYVAHYSSERPRA